MLIDALEELNTSNILLLLDQSSFPVEKYPSSLQIVLDADYEREILDPNNTNAIPSTRVCNANPDCNSWGDREGYCTYNEHGSGHISVGCPNYRECLFMEAEEELEPSAYAIGADFAPKVYEVRDNYLTNNENRKKWIDRFYYVSDVVHSNLTFTVAVDLYHLSNTNFFDILTNHDNSNYNDSIPINANSKPYLLGLCNGTKTLTTDPKTLAIMDSTINKINEFDGKTLSYINANF